MPETVRAFIAVPIPKPVVAHLGLLQEKLKRTGLEHLKWVEPENIHITLKFFGDIPTADVNEIGAIMKEAVKGVRPIDLKASGTGVFPGIRKAKVLWAGLQGEIQKLTDLQKNLEKALEDVGYAKEDRPFKGHLTLARIKTELNPEIIMKALEKCTGLESKPFRADRIILFKSDLKRSGPVYASLFEAIFE